VVDQFKGSGNKDAVSSELDMLRALEKMGKIRLNNLAVLPVKIDPSLFKEEDKMILELAQLTNSILLTSDQILKDRSVMQERPTVYIPPEVFGKIKMIQEVRNP
jgi:predicted PilT family ATPase